MHLLVAPNKAISFGVYPLEWVQAVNSNIATAENSTHNQSAKTVHYAVGQPQEGHLQHEKPSANIFRQMERGEQSEVAVGWDKPPRRNM